MIDPERTPLWSVTADDCEWSYTRGTGAGGQKKNKTSSAVHCTHRPSGAHGYSEESRSQVDNRRSAFVKMFHDRRGRRARDGSGLGRGQRGRQMGSSPDK